MNIQSDSANTNPSIEASKSFDFIGSLTESNLIRSKQSFSHFTGRDIAELAFLYLLTLEILRHHVKYVDVAKRYASQTMRYGSFAHFYAGGNDLYQMLHVLLGEDRAEAVSHLKDTKSSIKFLQNVTLDDRRTRDYLKAVARGSISRSTVTSYLLHAELKLKISVSNYRSMRRLISDWPDLSEHERKLVVTRLLQAYRARLIRSELKPHLEAFAQEKHLELQDVNNPEEERS